MRWRCQAGAWVLAAAGRGEAVAVGAAARGSSWLPAALGKAVSASESVSLPPAATGTNRSWPKLPSLELCPLGGKPIALYPSSFFSIPTSLSRFLFPPLTTLLSPLSVPGPSHLTLTPHPHPGQPPSQMFPLVPALGGFPLIYACPPFLCLFIEPITEILHF